MAQLDVVTAKTARFTTIVEQAGHPEPYTLWQDPGKDAEFQKALREERVMTVLRDPTSTKADAAVIGYLKKPNASYLIFPRSLKSFKNRRVVGVKYDLLTMPKPRGNVVKTARTRGRAFTPPRVVAPLQTSKTAERPKRPEPHPPSTPRFEVHAKVIHTASRSIEVEARNQREARKAAIEQLQNDSADLRGGERQVKITKVTRTRE